MRRGLLLILFLLPLVAGAQSRFHRRVPHLPYAALERSRLTFPGDSAAFDAFLRRLDEVVVTGRGKIRMLHIGGSHVQAGTWTDQLRRNLLSLHYGIDGGRGLVFPYAAAGTNTPSSYQSRGWGSWSADRCLKPETRLGVTGMSLTATDSASVLVDLTPRERKFASPGYTFRSVDIRGYGDVEPVLIYGRDTLRGQAEPGHWHFDLPHYCDYLRIGFRKPYGTFTMRGAYLDKSPDGLTLSEAGVNGASTVSWLKCEDWERDLRLLQPDLVIFSLGINDIQGGDFDPQAFEQRYNRLVREALRANPNAVFLFTTLTDSYFHRRGPNPHGVEASAAVIRLARKYNAAVWDQFTLMGGLGSVDAWAQDGLAQGDRIHFTAEGYTLFGDLLFNALMDRYSQVCR